MHIFTIAISVVFSAFLALLFNCFVNIHANVNCKKCKQSVTCVVCSMFCIVFISGSAMLSELYGYNSFL